MVQKRILEFNNNNNNNSESNFRQILVLATLTNTTIIIKNINNTKNDQNQNTGLKDFQVSFIRLLEKITNGSIIEINHTGTMISYKPGFICGSTTSGHNNTTTIHHNCPNSRSIGYFLEGILPLAPFGKFPLNLVLTGITNDNVDTSVDLIRTVLLPQLARFGIDEDALELKVNKRGNYLSSLI